MFLMAASDIGDPVGCFWGVTNTKGFWRMQKKLKPFPKNVILTCIVLTYDLL